MLTKKKTRNNNYIKHVHSDIRWCFAM